MNTVWAKCRLRVESAWLGLASVGLVALRLYRIDDPITSGGWAFRFTQTAYGIRSMMRVGLNPFAAEVPVLGPPWKIPYEFPIFQLLAACLGNVLRLDSSAAGRVMALVSHSFAGICVYLLARSLFGVRVAVGAYLIFMCSAFGYNWGAEVSIEYLSVGLCVLGLVVFMIALDRRSVGLTLTAGLIAALGALTKITTASSWLLVAGLLMAWMQRRDRVVVRLTALWLLLGLTPSVAWNRWADATKVRNRHTGWLSSWNLNDHHFGHLHDPRQLLNAPMWRAFIEHSTEATLGSPLIAVVLMVLVLSAPWARVNGRWLALIGLAPLVAFTRLYLGHEYYFIAISPVVAIVGGAGIETVRRWVATSWKTGVGIGSTFIGALIVTGMSWISPEGVENLNNSLPGSAAPQLRFDEISAATTVSDHIIVIGMDWSPVFLYTVDRKGLMLRPSGTRPDDAELGSFYEYVYWAEANPTPEQWAEYFPADLRYEAISPNFYRIFPIIG